MLERTIDLVRTDDPGLEGPSATRDRLKARFPAGAVRRMTQLGLLVGALVGELDPAADDAVVYTTQFGESRALEGFLESFPTASPTLFQTSIHPSAVQQGLIARQRPLREFIPMAGGGQLVAHALLAALLSPGERVVLCGGEERGTWLATPGAASERAFAYAMALTRTAKPERAGRIVMTPTADVSGALPLPAWFDLLHQRRPFSGAVAPGWQLDLTWR